MKTNTLHGILKIKNQKKNKEHRSHGRLKDLVALEEYL